MDPLATGENGPLFLAGVVFEVDGVGVGDKSIDHAAAMTWSPNTSPHRPKGLGW